MEKEASEHYPNETGGAFIGYWASENEVVITALIGAGPEAKRSRYRFEPDGEFQAAKIAELYEQSGRVHTYLGDWHTHPDGLLRLSNTDKKTLHRISREPGARAKNPIMLILNGKKTWTPKVWKWIDSRYFWKRKEIEFTIQIY